MVFATVADIEAFLAGRKAIFGHPAWEADESRARVLLRASLKLEDGRIPGNAFVQLVATLHTTPQRGSMALVCDGRPVHRMSYRPDHPHANPFHKKVSRALRGLTLPAGLTRIHRWRENRVWPRPPDDNLPVAEPVRPEPESYADAMQIFFRECGIEGCVEPPPWEPRLVS
ncbi:MAG: hypothetical protein KatS3mg119_0886 [Rhodothalassiaceae bacterium]|nr:MAG: hypothetical protein KatS3mg119_0886 [Rhodothalassiaceae bacterium]